MVSTDDRPCGELPGHAAASGRGSPRRLLSEALRNVERHAGTGQAEVTVTAVRVGGHRDH